MIKKTRTVFIEAVLFVTLVLSLTGCTSKTSDPVAQDFQYRYEPAREGRKLIYPRDHGAHRDASYEWWYFTGHVLSEGVERAGFQLTVFRVSPLAGPVSGDARGLRPEQASYLIAHLAMTDLESKTYVHHSYELRERLGQTSVSNEKMRIQMPGLEVEQRSIGEGIRFHADFKESGRSYQIEADVKPSKKLILHGHDGYSRKGRCATCASHYSSYTRLEGSASVGRVGDLRVGKGLVWFDHEFGSNTLEAGQAGWDWFSIQLQNGWDLMLFQLREESGQPGFASGTWVAPDGTSGALESSAFHLEPKGTWKSPRSGAKYPAIWRVSLPAQMATRELSEVELIPKLADQEIATTAGVGLATYWEGSCEVRDARGKDVGWSYVEMTGYDRDARPRF